MLIVFFVFVLFHESFTIICVPCLGHLNQETGFPFLISLLLFDVASFEYSILLILAAFFIAHSFSGSVPWCLGGWIAGPGRASSSRARTGPGLRKPAPAVL